MQSIVTDRSVCHTNEPCNNGWTDRDAVWVEGSGRPRNHVLVHIFPWEGTILKGKGHPIVKYRDTAIICAKMAEQIQMLFGL